MLTTPRTALGGDVWQRTCEDCESVLAYRGKEAGECGIERGDTSERSEAGSRNVAAQAGREVVKQVKEGKWPQYLGVLG